MNELRAGRTLKINYSMFYRYPAADIHFIKFSFVFFSSVFPCNLNRCIVKYSLLCSRDTYLCSEILSLFLLFSYRFQYSFDYELCPRNFHRSVRETITFPRFDFLTRERRLCVTRFQLRIAFHWDGLIFVPKWPIATLEYFLDTFRLSSFISRQRFQYSFFSLLFQLHQYFCTCSIRWFSII